MRDAVIYFKDSANMDELSNESVSLTVTSPPYYSMRGFVEWENYQQYIAKMFKIFKEVCRVTQKDRYFVCNCSDYMDKGIKYSIPADLTFIAQKAGFLYRDDIIWLKPTGCGAGSSGSGKRGGNVIQNPYPMRYYPDNEYEHWLIFRKPIEKRIPFPRPECDKIPFHKVRAHLKDYWKSPTVRRNQHSPEAEHPAMFPIFFPRMFVMLYSFTGETVLDPFVGSGTTALAAINQHRKAVGYEIDTRWRKVIEEKLLANVVRLGEYAEATLNERLLDEGKER